MEQISQEEVQPGENNQRARPRRGQAALPVPNPHLHHGDFREARGSTPIRFVPSLAGMRGPDGEAPSGENHRAADHGELPVKASRFSPS